MGLEPTQAEAYKNLNLARLPIPTLPHDHKLCYQVFAEMSITIFNFFRKLRKLKFSTPSQKCAGTPHLHTKSSSPVLGTVLHEYTYDGMV